MTEAARALVVVPAYNEDATVADVVKAVITAGYPVVVVDDGSSDWTGDRAAAAGATVLRLPVNVGVGGALRCGFRYAVDHGYDVVVQCDADGQHRPEEIPPLLEGIAAGAHLVIGSRFAATGTGFPAARVRRLGMRMVTRLARYFSGVQLTDATSGFRAIGKPLLEEFAADYPTEFLGDTVEAVIMAANGGYRIVEVATPMDPRSVGRVAGWGTGRRLVRRAAGRGRPAAGWAEDVVAPGPSGCGANRQRQLRGASWAGRGAVARVSMTLLPNLPAKSWKLARRTSEVVADEGQVGGEHVVKRLQDAGQGKVRRIEVHHEPARQVSIGHDPCHLRLPPP